MAEAAQPLSWTLSITGALVALATFVKVVVVPLLRFARRAGHFLDDWQGEPERPGQPARPGYSERLAQVEQVIREVKAQVMPNGGSSLRDAVDKTNAALTEHIKESTADRAALHRAVDHLAAYYGTVSTAVDALATETHEHHDQGEESEDDGTA